MPLLTQQNREALTQPNPCDGGAACTCEPGNYYVSAVDGNTHWLVAGPYKTHSEAQSLRRREQDISEEHDPRSFWWSWGVCNIHDSDARPGILNQHNLI